MAGLHPLELLNLAGALVTALLAVLSPESRARLVAAWSLVGVTAASVIVPGPRVASYGVYAAALLLLVAAWAASARVASAPRRSVWRRGRGADDEHVTPPGSPWLWVARVVLLLATAAAVAVALGHLEAPWAELVGPVP